MEVLKGFGDALRHGWHHAAEGWRDLRHRASTALTHFLPRKGETADPGWSSPRWGLVAGEVIDRGDSILAQLELPGIRREDVEVSVQDGMLRVTGEKRRDREHAGANYYLMERAYGAFERSVQLPPGVDADSAQARLSDGVLEVQLKKRPGAAATRRYGIAVK